MTTIPPLPGAVGDQLEERYDFTCPECGKDQAAGPSLFMLMNLNTGAAGCIRCRSPLHLQIADCGTKMTAMRYDRYEELRKEIAE